MFHRTIISLKSSKYGNCWCTNLNSNDQAALLLLLYRLMMEWRWVHYLVSKHKHKSKLLVQNFSVKKVSGPSAPPPPFSRGVCEFSILIPESNGASPCLENHWRIEVRSITSLWTVRPFYMWLSPSCSPVGTMKKECEVFIALAQLYDFQIISISHDIQSHLKEYLFWCMSSFKTPTVFMKSQLIPDLFRVEFYWLVTWEHFFFSQWKKPPKHLKIIIDSEARVSRVWASTGATVVVHFNKHGTE